MTPQHRCPWCLAVLVALGMASAIPQAAFAQTIITGHHDRHPNGYRLLGSGPFVVPADSAVGPSATFNQNHSDGFIIERGPANTVSVTILGGQFCENARLGLRASGAHLTIHGGQFDDNRQGGLATSDSTVVVSGGEFDGNTYDGLSVGSDSHVIVSGGTFENNKGAGLFALGTASYPAVITVTGGQYIGNSTDFDAYYTDGSFGTIEIFGHFVGLSPGQVQTLPAGFGIFTGTLENETTPAQKFTYYCGAFGLGPTPPTAIIRLHDMAAAPEPSNFVCFALGLFSLAGLAFQCRLNRRP